MKNQFQTYFFPHDNKKHHVKALDGLRGIAILIVLLSHASNAGIFINQYLNFNRCGVVGVYLFFLLSSYLLDAQIARTLINGKANFKYWLNYFLRRFLRIYPLYFLAVIFYYFSNKYFVFTAIKKTSDIKNHLLLMDGKEIFWSIPVEFKYYFLSPLIMWFCHSILKWNLKRIGFLFTLIIFFSIAYQQNFGFQNISTIRYLPIFLLGAFIGIYEIKEKNKLVNLVKSKYLQALPTIATLLIFVSIPYYFQSIFGFKYYFFNAIYYLPFTILWTIILIWCLYSNALLKKIMEFKPLRFIGNISFSLYLFHIPLLTALRKNVIPVPKDVKIYAFFGIIILFSTLTYFLIERPLSKIKINNN